MSSLGDASTARNVPSLANVSFVRNAPCLHDEKITRTDLAVRNVGTDKSVPTIELHMMDLKTYLPLISCSSLIMRLMQYPCNVIRTRLQMQVGKDVYSGTWGAIRNISRSEGVRGFYTGFSVYCVTIVPSLCYMSSYETARHFMNRHSSLNKGWLKSLVGGGVASVVSQTISVPIHVVNQHIMLLEGQRNKGQCLAEQSSKKLTKLQEIHVSDALRQRHFGTVRAVTSHIYTHENVRGFYRGYLISMGFFVPNSALWWFFYETYKERLLTVIPDFVPRLFVMSCFAAPLAGLSAASITNGVDVIRVRIQVRGGTVSTTVKQLLKEEGYRFWWKGLSARLLQSCVSSVLMFSLYEPVKRWSLKEEYSGAAKW